MSHRSLQLFHVQLSTARRRSSLAANTRSRSTTPFFLSPRARPPRLSRSFRSSLVVASLACESPGRPPRHSARLARLIFRSRYTSGRIGACAGRRAWSHLWRASLLSNRNRDALEESSLQATATNRQRNPAKL